MLVTVQSRWADGCSAGMSRHSSSTPTATKNSRLSPLLHSFLCRSHTPSPGSPRRHTPRNVFFSKSYLINVMDIKVPKTKSFPTPHSSLRCISTRTLNTHLLPTKVTYGTLPGSSPSSPSLSSPHEVTAQGREPRQTTPPSSIHLLPLPPHFSVHASWT